MATSYSNIVKAGSLALLCFFCGYGMAQDKPPGNKASLNVLAPLNFRYETAQELLQQKTIREALELQIKIKQEDVIVSAKANVYGGAESFALANLLALRLSSKTSPTAIVANTTIPLSPSFITLFLQPRSPNGVKHYSFFYDLVLNPSKTIITPGSYNFSIDFTITPQ